MLFPTTDFAIFFVLVFLGHWVLNHKPTPWKLFMIAASYVFYSWWNWHFVLLLVGVSVIAQVGAIAVSWQNHRKRRKVAVTIAVAATLAPLAYFKYYGFFSVNVANALNGIGIHASLPLIEVVLPVGVSFFTFMAIAYVMDVYRRDIQVASWIDVFLYLSFFPHLVAGPIVRPAELIPQLDVRRDQRHIDVAGSAWLILGGLFKKVVISSYLSTAIVAPVFGDPARASALDAIFAIVGFAVVIYTDFSGYTDIAIGVAKLLGFEFPQNFNRPYSARSLQDFWRRWHMTLSRWLRDYLYIPLGGNQRGERRMYENIMITMILGGLWHGADWTFVLWGTLHGVGMAVGQWRRAHRTKHPPETAGVIWAQRAATFAFVCVGWVFFRSDSVATAFTMLGRLLWGWTTPTTMVNPLVVGVIAGTLALQFVPPGIGEIWRSRISELKPVPMGIGFATVLFLITTLGPLGVAPFIYFQF